MITRLIHGLRRRISHTVPIQTDVVLKTTYYEQGNQWYLPTLVGPSTFLAEVAGSTAVQNVLAVLELLTSDSYMDFIIRFYLQGLERFGQNWVYADINTVLIGLSKLIAPTSYLEIGVRRGRSMAMVASQVRQCDIIGFDLWIGNYAGMPNPGKEFVCQELERIGHNGKRVFFDGDSRATVPKYFEEHPSQCFDMITIDGDHTLEGARRDLLNVMPRLKVGGALIFDDIANQSHMYLDRLWNEIVVDNPQFSAWSFREVGFGVGFAIKKC